MQTPIAASGLDPALAGLANLAGGSARRWTIAFAGIVHHHAVGVETPAESADGALHAPNPSTRQAVAIALVGDPELLFLDEPTAVLTPQETEEIFAVLRRLAEAGHSIVFISHKLYEVLEIAHRITVIRPGRVVGEHRPAETNEDDLAELTVGREVQMGVNSDDGFRTTTAANPLEQLNSQIVGVADLGRGAADTIDWIFVPKAGIYPFRTVWIQGGGGANMEWFSVDDSGNKILLNDASNPKALKA